MADKYCFTKVVTTDGSYSVIRGSSFRVTPAGVLEVFLNNDCFAAYNRDAWSSVAQLYEAPILAGIRGDRDDLGNPLER